MVLMVLLLSACGGAPVNDEAELREIAGNYFGVLKLGEESKMELHLQLKPNGFYLITHQDLKDPKILVRENGVFTLQDQEIQLARKQTGFRYFRYEAGMVFVYNLFHEPYTSFSDSSFYLKPRYRPESDDQ